VEDPESNLSRFASVASKSPSEITTNIDLKVKIFYRAVIVDLAANSLSINVHDCCRYSDLPNGDAKYLVLKPVGATLLTHEVGRPFTLIFNIK